ncbi:MAG: acetyl-CoA carboxylase biotin carboxylase subunit [Clostridia bacterium]|jgi:acetyl-CoA carboxylase biotin carboxylase subunit|nr:acetyl-CoA carboxylase biotin carboxylase subunit [Clostridium sp.]MEE0127313.1 acetyl-CoA carboxylase biotin carboxylase subunit [Clostridia bacterium]HJJ12712.1 acetyl-CoA carboxylase biotin carboxylase subunit [Clostridiaceae bacterium]
MLKKILIANRGEIAVRIIRACREMGIKTVAVYSEADKTALHTKLADEAICIGPAISTKSYLNVKAIIEAACLTGADSIHPGFGFLSENNSFAKMCDEIGIKFIGPKPEIIELMGNKSKAKETMKSVGVPVVPGSDGLIYTMQEAINISNQIGYPVIIKASAGGGGKGIRIAYSEEELRKAYEIVKQEALNSFNDDSIYIEKFIENPRHIEIQIMADEYGNAVHLGERDCTVQRKNQKMLEETPSGVIDSRLREKMGAIAVKAVKEVGYTNVGTIEFLVDKNKDFYFMEMNTRIQVEHPVTEMVTGLDLIKEQIRIASGEKMKYRQRDINFNGHSLEARINAENPYKNFMPSPGTIEELHLPGGNGIRVDTAVYSGYKVPQNYDSMIAKVIVHGKDRNESIAKMKSALSEFVISGIETNIDFLLKILDNENFVNNEYDTSFIEKEFEK